MRREIPPFEKPVPLSPRGAGSPDTHRGAHHVAQAKVEAALLVHGVVQPGELGQRWPVVGKWVIPQAVIGAVRGHVGAASCLQRTGHPTREADEAPSGAMVVGLSANPSSQLCCLSFPDASLFLGISYPGLRLPRSQVSIKGDPNSGTLPTPQKPALPFPSFSPAPEIGGLEVWGLRWAQHTGTCTLPQLSPGLPVTLRDTGWHSLQVAAQLLLAAAGPVESVEGCLHQGRHDAAQPYLVTTAVALPVMFHAQPVWEPSSLTGTPLATLTC